MSRGAHSHEIWERWRTGESFNPMGRALGAPMHVVRSFLAQADGIRQAARRRAKQHLTAADREEVSRGVAAGESARRIGCRLGRSPSSISREIACSATAAASTAGPPPWTRRRSSGPGVRNRRSWPCCCRPSERWSRRSSR
ncbi:helix-turn-helix domain-containing protein [Streptomyces cinnamoneus]|uniref:helix-turn-helix domain-containing protein n=1 Tax=Streptomyces cinnamoneus TaxID=53446 RepID=UPI003570BD3E